MHIPLASRAVVELEDGTQVFALEPGTHLVVWPDDTIQLFEPHEGGMRPLRFNYKEKTGVGPLTDDQLTFLLNIVCAFADLWHKEVSGYQGAKLAVVFERQRQMTNAAGARIA
jgi:hypothetical protein